MKYIDAEKLITEIRKLRSESCISESDDYYEFAKTEIIDIINSLQQVQPEVDLEKEAVAFCFDNGINITPYQATRIARHFYELGRIAQIEQNKALAAQVVKLSKEKGGSK